MAGEDDLNGSVLVKISCAISEKNMRAIGVIYMGFKKNEIKDLTKMEIINKWKRMAETNDKQRLADILYDASAEYSLIDHSEIKEILDVEKSGNPVLSPVPSDVKSPLTDSELGRLATKISPDDMNLLGQGHLGFKPHQLDQYEKNNPKDCWSVNFEILVNWKNRDSKNGRKELACVLYKAAARGMLDMRCIKSVLGVSQEMLKAEESGRGDEKRQVGKTSSETKGSNQPAVVEYKRDPADGSSEPEASSSTSGPTYNETMEDLMRKLGDKTTFPEGVPVAGHPLGVPGYIDHFNWMNMEEIKRITSTLIYEGMKTVVVAIVDTGIKEDHLDLKDKILTIYSRCSVSGDPKIDEANHGTMVAGIIALNGPENVKIINIKTKYEHVVEALKYIETLDITDDKVDIINMSFELDEKRDWPGLDDVLDKLSKSKILIAAAGNSGSQGSNTVKIPARHRKVICVGACNMYGKSADLSSVGDEVVCLCPGEGVLSTSSKLNEHGKLYMFMNGTSFSAPFACAVAAHVLVAIDQRKGSDAREKLKTKMRYVLGSMSTPDKLLTPFDKCFEYLHLLDRQYDYALKDKKTP